MLYLHRNQTPWLKGAPAKDIIIYMDDWTNAIISKQEEEVIYIYIYKSKGKRLLLVPHHNIVDAHAKKSGVIDLFKLHILGLIGQEDAKDDQDTLVAKHPVNQSQMKVDNRVWDHEHKSC